MNEYDYSGSGVLGKLAAIRGDAYGDVLTMATPSIVFYPGQHIEIFNEDKSVNRGKFTVIECDTLANTLRIDAKIYEIARPGDLVCISHNLSRTVRA